MGFRVGEPTAARATCAHLAPPSQQALRWLRHRVPGARPKHRTGWRRVPSAGAAAARARASARVSGGRGGWPAGEPPRLLRERERQTAPRITIAAGAAAAAGLAFAGEQAFGRLI